MQTPQIIRDENGEPLEGQQPDGNFYNGGIWWFRRTYEIGTGPLEYFYTLWVGTQHRNGNFSGYRFIRNLAHEKEDALAKARELTGEDLPIFDIKHFNRRQGKPFDPTQTPEQVKMTFGKYSGRTLADLLATDYGYLWFLAVKSDWQPSQTKHAALLEYIRGIFGDEITDYAAYQEFVKEERAARDAARADVPDFNGARVTIHAKLLSTKWVENNFGDTLKMLVEHADGWKLYGSCPQGIANDTPLQGDEVQFDAVVNRSDRDSKFGFFNRPTKARIVKDSPEKVRPL